MPEDTNSHNTDMQRNFQGGSRPDPLVFRLAVAVVAGVVLVVAVSTAWLAALGRDAPQSLSALGQTALGFLGGFLVTPPRGR